MQNERMQEALKQYLTSPEALNYMNFLTKEASESEASKNVYLARQLEEKQRGR